MGSGAAEGRKTKLTYRFSVSSCVFLCQTLPPAYPQKNLSTVTVVYPEFAPKVGIQGVHFNPKLEAAVKILAPNRKCIFKSPVRGCRGCVLLIFFCMFWREMLRNGTIAYPCEQSTFPFQKSDRYDKGTISFQCERSLRGGMFQNC